MRLTPRMASAARPSAWATALAAALGLALAGCGSGQSGAASSSTAATAASAPAATTPSTSTAAGATTTSSSATGAAAPAGTTAPGASLALEAPALVDYKPGANANSPTYRLQVSVLAIQKGGQADLDGVELEKSQQGKTPYYVKLRIRNEGSGNASAEDGVPAVGFQAIDDRGQQGQELTVLGNFRPCETVVQPKDFTRGVTYQTCVIYLVGGSGSIVQEDWTGSVDKYTENPIVWKAS